MENFLVCHIRVDGDLIERKKSLEALGLQVLYVSNFSCDDGLSSMYIKIPSDGAASQYIAILSNLSFIKHIEQPRNFSI